MTLDSASHSTSAFSPEDERLHFERLISDLATRFLNAPAHQVDAHIEDALLAIRKFLDMDRGWLFQFRDASNELQIIHRALGDLPLRPPADAPNQYPWLAATLRAL